MLQKPSTFLITIKKFYTPFLFDEVHWVPVRSLDLKSGRIQDGYLIKAELLLNFLCTGKALIRGEQSFGGWS